MIQSNKLFLDTSFFIAFIDRVDLNHQKAALILAKLANQNSRLYTSTVTLLNTFNRLEKDMGSTLSHDFLQAILESDIQILYPTQTELISAYRSIRATQSRKASLSEIINVTLMEKNNIKEILTFDFWHNLNNTSVHLI